jgi:GIY-YIG catalytic domain
MGFAGQVLASEARQDALRSLGEGGLSPLHYVYLLESLSFPGERYVGSTTDPRARLAEHNAGKSPHTSKFKPWRMVT